MRPVAAALAAVLAAVLAAALLPGAAAAQDLSMEHVEIVDIDGDGAISLDEFRAFGSNAFIELDPDADNALDPADLEGLADAAAFAAMDADGDGRVSRMEFDAQLLADFRAADQDDDGLLSPGD